VQGATGPSGLTDGDQTIAGVKTFSNTIVGRAASGFASLSELVTNSASIQIQETNTGTSAFRYIPMISGLSTSPSGYRQHTVFGSYRDTIWGSAFIAVGGNDSHPTVAYTFHYDGNGTAPASWRAPIFYDSDNTTYYVDPNSGTSLRTAGSWISDNTPVWGGDVVGKLEYHNSRWYASTSVGFLVRNGSGSNMFSVENGVAIATADMRAPIFYDSENTSFYLDPTGSTSLNAAGSLVASGNITLNNGANRRVRIGSVTNYSYDLQTTGDDFQIIEAGTTPRFTIKYPSGFVGLNTASPSEELEAFGTDASIIVHNSGQSRGGISALSGARIALTTTTPGDDLVFGYAGSPITSAGFVPRMTIDNGTGSITSAVDFRAPIFYDSNNTARYVDPTSTSLVTTIEAYDGSGFRTFATPSASVTSQLYFANAGNTRAWNWQLDENNDAALWNYNGSAWVKRVTIGENATIEQGNNYAHPEIEWSAVSATGMVIFYLPGTTANFGMVHMVFDIYEYVTGKTATVIIGGHNWTTPAWFNNGCQVIGWTDKTVRLGVKDGRFCVVFGGVGSSWTYGTIRLRKIHNASFYNNIMNLAGNWSTEATNTESFTTVTGDLRQLRTSNTFTADGDVRSPIFYDSNDTAYFIDPNSTSVLNTVRAAQIQHSSGNVAIALNDATWTRLHDPNGVTKLWLGGADPNNYYNANIHYFRNLSSATTMTIDANGVVIASADMRAPIFYDSNNTGFYTDPASTSVLNNLIISRNVASPSNYYNDLQLEVQATSGTAGIGLHRPGFSHCGIYHDSINQLKFNFNSGTVTLDHNVGTVIGSGNYNSYAPTLTGGGASGTWGINITGNAATASGLPTRYDGGVITNPQHYFSQSLGLRVAMTGYPVVWSDTLWINGYAGGDVLSMCALHFSRQATPRMWISTQQSTATSYGTAFEIPSLGYNSGNGNGLYAGIYYDSNDTGYYVDPNSTSRLQTVQMGNTLNLNGWQESVATTSFRGIEFHSVGDRSYYIGKDAGAWTQPLTIAFYTGIRYFASPDYNGSRFFNSNNGSMLFSIGDGDGSVRVTNDIRSPIYYDSNNTGYRADPAGDSQFSSVFADNWFRAQGNSGFWFQDYGRGMRSPDGEGNPYGNVATHGTGRNGWLGWGIGSRHVFMSTGGDNVGVHDNSRGWIWYWNGSFTQFDYGYTQFAGSARAPIFYDNNDTAFFTDPNDTSRTNIINSNIYGRPAHNQGHLRGGYNNIGASEGQTSPIYCIGSSYEPAATTLGVMYGIGFTASGSFFPSGASGWGLYVAANGVARVFLSGDTGDITATGNITAYASDRRLKTNITPISNALDKVMKIRGVEFDWVDNIEELGFHPQSIHETGVIAQEIQAVVSDAVRIAPFNKIATDISGIDNEYLTVDKEKIIPLLIEAIKEQQTLINNMQAQINSIKEDK
jgi:hypothetical protein